MSCEACQDRGWLIVTKYPGAEIDVERCDLCKKFDDDDTARIAFRLGSLDSTP